MYLGKTMNLFELFKRLRPGRARVRRRPSSVTLKTGRAARSPVPDDDTLSSTALSWLRQLPVSVRPKELCGVYPRLANRIALCWDDLALVDEIFNELLLDRRGGRAGFPSLVAAELLRLHALHERRLAAAGLRRAVGLLERNTAR